MSTISGWTSALFCIVVVVVVILGIVSLMQYRQKKQEEKRVEDVLSRQNEWGEVMCRWMIENDIPMDSRTTEIMENLPAWGAAACQRTLQKKVTIGDNSEMVQLAYGSPTSIDEKNVTAEDNQYRWVYGTPSKGATYVWFKNDIVTKIEM